MSAIPVEAVVGRYVAAGRFADVPPDAVRVATRAIRDCLGVIAAGLGEESGRLVADQVRADGATGPATVLGRGFDTSPAAAAWATATTAHALDFDDSHHPSMTHPTAVLLPALLAVAQARASSGAELLTAYLYALDAATAIGGGLNPDHYSAGWHPTATVGAIGAALGAARLSGLDADRTTQAVAIAANRASGLRAVFGSMGKAMNAGTAAQTGVLAADLAGRGFTSGTAVLDAFAATHGAPPPRLSHPLDHTFTAAVGGLSLKRFPSCGVTQAPLEAAVRMAVTTDRRPADIVDVACVVEPYIRRMLIADPPRTGSEARFQLEHCVAVALLDRTAGMAQFTDARATDPDVRALAGRIRIVDRPGDAPPDLRWPCALRVTWRDGHTADVVVDAPAGRSFGELLGEAELTAKFTDCVGYAGLTAAETAGLIAQLDDLASLSTLDPIVAPFRRTLGGLTSSGSDNHNVEAHTTI